MLSLTHLSDGGSGDFPVSRRCTGQVQWIGVLLALIKVEMLPGSSTFTVLFFIFNWPDTTYSLEKAYPNYSIHEHVPTGFFFTNWSRAHNYSYYLSEGWVNELEPHGPFFWNNLDTTGLEVSTLTVINQKHFNPFMHGGQWFNYASKSIYSLILIHSCTVAH